MYKVKQAKKRKTAEEMEVSDLRKTLTQNCDWNY